MCVFRDLCREGGREVDLCKISYVGVDYDFFWVGGALEFEYILSNQRMFENLKIVFSSKHPIVVEYHGYNVSSLPLLLPPHPETGVLTWLCFGRL